MSPTLRELADLAPPAGTEEEVLKTYTLQLIGVREGFPFHAPRLPASLLHEIEENVNDLINNHYRVEIKEWDDE